MIVFFFKHSVRPGIFVGAEFGWNLLLAGVGHPDLILALLDNRILLLKLK
jgi:hypothetical protein